MKTFIEFIFVFAGAVFLYAMGIASGFDANGWQYWVIVFPLSGAHGAAVACLMRPSRQP